MAAGDGEKQWTDGRFFDLFRGREGDARAASDRAIEAQRKAEAKAALAGIEEEPAPEEGAGGMHTGRGSVTFSDVKARRYLKRLKQAAKATDARIDALEAAQAEFAEKAAKFAEKLDRRDETMGRGLDWALSMAGTAVSVINAGEAPANPLANMASEALDGLAGSNGGGGYGQNYAKTMRLGAAVLKLVAYYDPKQGLASLFTMGKAKGGRGGGNQGLTSILTPTAPTGPSIAI